MPFSKLNFRKLCSWGAQSYKQNVSEEAGMNPGILFHRLMRPWGHIWKSGTPGGPGTEGKLTRQSRGLRAFRKREGKAYARPRPKADPWGLYSCPMNEWPAIRKCSGPLSILSEEGSPWSWEVLLLASWRVCLEGLPSKTTRECGVCPLAPTQGELLCPSLTPRPVWRFPRSRCWRSTGHFCSSFRHCQPSSAFQRWEFVESITIVSFTLSNPTEHQHLPDSRLVFSEFASLMRDVRLSLGVD